MGRRFDLLGTLQPNLNGVAPCKAGHALLYGRDAILAKGTTTRGGVEGGPAHLGTLLVACKQF